jgi:hypothetical protein
MWHENQSEDEQSDDADTWTEEDKSDIVFLGRTFENEDESKLSLSER